MSGRRLAQARQVTPFPVLALLALGCLGLTVFRPAGPWQAAGELLAVTAVGVGVWCRAADLARDGRTWGRSPWIRHLLIASPVLLGVDGALRVLGLDEVEIAYQAAAVTVVVGVLGLARGNLLQDRGATLDSMTVSATFAVLIWVVLDARLGTGFPGAESLLVACATTVFLLLGTVLRLLLMPRPRPPVVIPLTAALGLVLVGDLFRTWSRLIDRVDPASDAMISLLAVVFLARALVDPTLDDLAEASGAGRSVRLRRIPLIWAGVLPPALLGVRAVARWDLDVSSILVAWGLVLTLAGARISHLVTAIGVERARNQEGVRFQAAFDSAMVGMALVGAPEPGRDQLVEVNQRLCDILGRRPDELVGCEVTTLVAPDSYADLRAALDAVHESGRVPLDGDRQMIAAGGRQVWGRLGLSAAAAGCEHYAVLQVEDVSDGRRAQQRLEYLATHDPLTGLANRVLLADRLGHALSRRNRRGDIVVLAMDLDRFKLVNDSLGHAAGDQLLRVVSQRLSETLRPEDTVARLGGDEFVVLLEDLDDVTEAAVVADRIAVALAEPVPLIEGEATVAVSIGIAVAGPDDTGDSLLRNADMAMYRAKENGRSRHERFDEQMRDLVVHRMNTEQWLRDCVAGQGLQLAMQPVVDLHRGMVTGYEALVRCSHPDRGLLQPTEFLRVAEESGLIVPIGQWVMRTALNQAGRWRRRDGRRAPQMAVNVSARQVLAPGFYEEVTAALDESGVPATRLVLEIAENTLLEILDSAAGPLRRLREIGVRIAVDDFGTGYTSLAHLRQLPVDALKIDRSFVAGMSEEKPDGGVLQALIGLAHALGLQTVAEGVETPRQRRALRDYGCDLGQGFLLGPPSVVAGGNQAPVTRFPRALAPALSSPSRNK